MIGATADQLYRSLSAGDGRAMFRRRALSLAVARGDAYLSLALLSVLMRRNTEDNSAALVVAFLSGDDAGEVALPSYGYDS